MKQYHKNPTSDGCDAPEEQPEFIQPTTRGQLGTSNGVFSWGKYCKACNGYGSSLKESAPKCSTCDGSGVAPPTVEEVPF